MDSVIVGAIIGAIATISGIVLKHFLDKRNNKNKPQQSNMPQPPITDIINDVAPVTHLVENLPYKNKCFTGRTEKLEDIYKKLQDEKLVYISGMGGIGKSAIALQYAHKHKDDYDVIWWINSEEETSALMSFKDFVLRKNLIRKDDKNEKDVILRKVKDWLKDNLRWLFIYDNADKKDFKKWIEQYLPNSNNGDVIVTTQNSNFPIGEKIDLTAFSVAEAIEFLNKRAERVDVRDKDLVLVLDCFPLALEQAGAYLHERKAKSYAEYIAEYEKKLEHDEDLTHYDKSIYATLEISIAKMDVDGVRQMLDLCAYFAPERIPLSLFVESKIFSDVLKINVDVHDVVAELAKYSLLKYDDEHPELLYIHRLLQKTVKRKHEDTQWLSCCLDMVYGVFGYDFRNVHSMGAFGRDVVHVLEVACQAEERLGKNEVVQRKIAYLYHCAGLGYDCGSQYGEALKWYKKALVIRESVLGTNHPDTARIYNNIACVYNRQGRYDEALTEYKKALAIYESVLGTNHPDTADTYNNIACVYDNQGRYDEALTEYKKALATYESVFGKDHEFTKKVQNNINRLLSLKRD